MLKSYKISKITQTHEVMNENNLTDKEKITQILDYFQLKKSEFAQKIGVKDMHIYDLLRGQIGNLPRETLEKIVRAFPEISPLWLITGNGSMLNADNTNSGIMITQRDNNTATIYATIFVVFILKKC